MKAKPLMGVALLSAATAIIAGCSGAESAQQADEKVIESYGQLPGLSATHDQRLQDELARLADEKATPALLTDRSTAAETDGPTTPADKDNLAVALAEVFPKVDLALIDKRADKLFPVGKFQFNRVAMEEVLEFLKDHDEHCGQVREALSRPQCDFRFQLTKGVFADLSSVDAVRVAVRLEAFRAAQQLAADKPDEAVEPVVYMFRALQFLAREKHPASRRWAAFLREEALAVTEAIVQHPGVSRATMEELHERVQLQLDSWPPDANAWIGERAIGMHMFEMIRDGYILSLLTYDEIKQFKKDGTLTALARSAVKTIDEDQWFYLQTMRKIIEHCDEPYYRRKKVFQDIRRRIHATRETDEYPVIAARVVLEEFEEGHKIQAIDRARCEAWALALAESLGRQRPKYPINPYTGQPYRIDRQQTRVVVHGITDAVTDQPVVVPLGITD